MTDIPSHIGLQIENKYRIDAKIGSGGMATVYQATRLLIGDTVAIKILHPGRVDSIERFRREAEAAAKLKHPNVVPIYDFGVSADGLVYLAMELVEGKTIREMLRERGLFPPRMVAEITSQVCSALEAAHRKNIVHRDIKPDNIVVDATPEGTSVRVLDFGIAWMRDLAAANLTETGNIVGTPHYMSPEQCLGEEPDARSDIYSLGIVLFEMLTGVVPFNSRVSTAVVVQHVNQLPPSMKAINVGVPDAVESVVMRALAKQRDLRPRSAALLSAELNSAVAGHAVPTGRVSVRADGIPTTVKLPKPDWSGEARKSASSTSHSRRAVWMILASAAVVSVAAAGVYLGKQGVPDFVFSSGIGDAVRGSRADGSSRPTGSIDMRTLPVVDSSLGKDTAPPPTVRPSRGIVFTDEGSQGERPTFTIQAIPEQGPASPQPAPQPSSPRETGVSQPTPTRTASTPTRPTNRPTQTIQGFAEPNTSSVNPSPPAVVSAPVSVANTPAKNTETPATTPTTSKPSLIELADRAVKNCSDALRSRSAAVMTQLYQAATAQDEENKRKLLARMTDASANLTLRGLPQVGATQTFDDSAYTDMVVRLTWRGNFGRSESRQTTFRAKIAQKEGGSHISCRILGKAGL